jgi:hypothetical protein
LLERPGGRLPVLVELLLGARVFAFLEQVLCLVALEPGTAALFHNGIQCHQIFSVNYGIIEYVDWDRHQANEMRLLNPIVYTYLKDREQFSEEKELRVSLSAIGMGHFVLDDGSMMVFPTCSCRSISGRLLQTERFSKSCTRQGATRALFRRACAN